jgi:hypothetical protein
MIEHEAVNGGVAGLLARVNALPGNRVLVGVPSATDKNTGGRKGDIGNAELVYIHTHGVRPPAMRAEMKPELDKGTKYSVALQMYLHEHGYFAKDAGTNKYMRVPARPIIEPAIEYHKKEIAEEMGKVARAAMNGESIQEKLSNVGIIGQRRVQDWFTNPANGWAPNAPSTIKKKGSGKPLIDTGALRTSISYIVESGGGNA